MIHIFDCNNWLRVKYEKETGPMALRQLFTEAFTMTEPCFYIFDGFNSKAARRKIYADYKAKRNPAPDNFYEVLKVFKQLILLTPKMSIEVPEYEADDVINHIVVNYKGPERIRVYSTDRDFAPLKSDKVELTSNAILNAPPNEVRLYKAIVKDVSDNIPGVKGFGDKSWETLTQQSKADWMDFLNEVHNAVPIQNLSDKQIVWCNENAALLRAFWKVVDFLPMTNEQVNSRMKIGVADYEGANAILKGLAL